MEEKAFRTKVDEESGLDGFEMTFSNGCGISIVFHVGSYSDRGITTAEVAAFHPNGNWMLFQEGGWVEIPKYDEVMPRVTADEVAELIYTLSQY